MQAILYKLLFVIILLFPARNMPARTIHVATNGSDAAGNTGDNWTTALKSISNAVKQTVKGAGDVVLVSNGTYAITDKIYTLANNLTLRSFSGPEATVIEGGGQGIYGIHFESCTGVIDGFTIRGAGLGGLNLYSFYGGSNIVRNCMIISNSGAIGGGANANYGYSEFQNCVFLGNTASDRGGGLYCNTLGFIDNCRFQNNTAPMGAGVAFANRQFMRNCLVVSNTALNGGGGVWIRSYTTMENCTVVRNTALTNGGGAYGSYDYGNIVNSIVYFNNVGTGSASNYYFQGSYVVVTNSCIAPNIYSQWGSGISQSSTNVYAGDPRLVNSAGGDYRLADRSPCINTGTNHDWMVDALDFDGHRRLDPFTLLVDMGCYEFIPAGTMFCVK